MGVNMSWAHMMTLLLEEALRADLMKEGVLELMYNAQQ